MSLFDVAGWCAGLATGQRLPPPQLQKSTLQQGAVQDAVEEVWKRAPYIKERMVAEHAAHSTTLFSFSGEYWNWSMLCRGHQTVEKVSYVGGLDSNGAPHGMGAWHDTHKYGELLIGCAPLSSQGNKCLISLRTSRTF